MSDFLQEFTQWIEGLKTRKAEDLKILAGETGEWLKNCYDLIRQLQTENKGLKEFALKLVEGDEECLDVLVVHI